MGQLNNPIAKKYNTKFFHVNLFFDSRTPSFIRKGFTLIEVIIAIFLVTVGIVGVFTLINKSAGQMAASPNSLIAAYLAQEGIEIVRNIRDTNWTEPPPAMGERLWDEDLTLGDSRADYNDDSLTSWDNAPLKIDSSGYYNYDNGGDTIFYRKITITKIINIPETTDSNDYYLSVLIDVWWAEKGKINHVKAEDHLYNWH